MSVAAAAQHQRGGGGCVRVGMGACLCLHVWWVKAALMDAQKPKSVFSPS